MEIPPMPKLRRTTNAIKLKPKPKSNPKPSKLVKIVYGPELPLFIVGGVATVFLAFLATLPISDLVNPLLWFCMGLSVHVIARGLGSWVSARMRTNRQWRKSPCSRTLRYIARAFAP